MLGFIKEVYDEPWHEVTTGKLIGTSLGFFLFFILLIKDKDGFIFLIDHANLVFHCFHRKAPNRKGYYLSVLTTS